MMRSLLLIFLIAIPAASQKPLVRILNTSHPASREFQIGDRFEILITGAPNAPLSVRTTMQARTDWGPIFASTDSTGRWSTAGEFRKSDLGGWTELWTVGGKLAAPVVQFSVTAPCLPGGFALAQSTGLNIRVTCETSEGRQSFSTPSHSDLFRSPDGRTISGRAMPQTQDAYHTDILENLIMNQGSTPGSVALQSSRGGRGDETAGLIINLVGENALNPGEIRNVLAILRAAFAKPQTIAPGAKEPVQSLRLLDHLSGLADDDSLRRQIDETVAWLQTRPAADEGPR